MASNGWERGHAPTLRVADLLVDAGAGERPDRDQQVDQLRQALLEGPGVCPPTLRQAIATRARDLALGAPEPATNVPAALATYVDLVALSAYRVTDQHLAALREHGYSDDAILEVTLCAALGAGLARLERGLAVVRGV